MAADCGTVVVSPLASVTVQAEISMAPALDLASTSLPTFSALISTLFRK